jgi:hypothetical protein
MSVRGPNEKLLHFNSTRCQRTCKTSFAGLNYLRCFLLFFTEQNEIKK